MYSGSPNIRIKFSLLSFIKKTNLFFEYIVLLLIWYNIKNDLNHIKYNEI